MAPSEREGDMLAELVDDSSARLPVYSLRIIEKVRPLANNSTFSLYTRLTWLWVQSSKCRPFVLKKIFLVYCTKVRPGKKKKNTSAMHKPVATLVGATRYAFKPLGDCQVLGGSMSFSRLLLHPIAFGFSL